MTGLFATTFVAQPHFQIPEWLFAMILIVSVTAMLFAFFRDVEAGTARRLVMGCAVGVVLVFLYSHVASAASYIECKDAAIDGSWTQWFYQIFWIC